MSGTDHDTVRIFVGYDEPAPAQEILNLHLTNGGPWFDEYSNRGFADLWFAERDRMPAAE